MLTNAPTSSTCSNPVVATKFHRKQHFVPPMPFGAQVTKNGVLFTIYSKNATGMRVLLYDSVSDMDPRTVIQFDPEQERWGGVWRLFVPNLGHGQLYHLQCDGPFEPNRGHRFDGTSRLIDPYALALAGDFQPNTDGLLRPPKCVVIKNDFDWENDRPLKTPLEDSVIYEMHVGGFTKSPTSGVKHPGTYLGLIEKIPYLKDLGVTAVELMPVHEFPIRDFEGTLPERKNYWGYDGMAFFAPHRGFASGQEPGAQVNEFKQMVKELHAAGIEVILDVVFNHTCEGDDRGANISFKGLENHAYYMLDSNGSYKNFSGCGNTLNSNHPVVREMIISCLRNWVFNYHVDGFRFDLASILSRDRHGNLVDRPPLVESIAEDPFLADTKIIAEAWDAAGAYQVGNFGGDPRWAEWNGVYRDDVRKFWRGDWAMLGPLATRLAGSSDLYETSGRTPSASINFVTAHDGFTMNDLVSYDHKHNLENGEDNRDGTNDNHSCNYGIEGPTKSREINAIRLRQIKNMLSTLLLSQGVPMLVAGDECRRTQRGNNNPWCLDNEISWFNWDLVDEHKNVHRFVKELIRFRRDTPGLRRSQFLSGEFTSSGWCPDISWFNFDGSNVFDWHGPELPLAVLLSAQVDGEKGNDMFLLFNPTGTPRICKLPEDVTGRKWRVFVDTSKEAPNDIYPEYDGPELDRSGEVELPHHSLRCYITNGDIRTQESNF